MVAIKEFRDFLKLYKMYNFKYVKVQNLIPKKVEFYKQLLVHEEYFFSKII